jgi:hypothetical protein
MAGIASTLRTLWLQLLLDVWHQLLQQLLTNAAAECCALLWCWQVLGHSLPQNVAAHRQNQKRNLGVQFRKAPVSYCMMESSSHTCMAQPAHG